jgi:peptidoglycan/LPS O-acetylase OafA/YrhL
MMALAEPTAVAQPSRHMPVLDGLRGLAILLVMVYHFTGGTDNTASGVDLWFSRVTGIGWCGVDLFFVLSGFLITGILYDTRNSPTYLRDFYARRALRIFPLYYGVLLVVFLILPRIVRGSIPGLESVSGYQAWLWLYCGNIATFFKGEQIFRDGMIQTTHFWSLAVEEQFYLIWPLFVLWLRREALMKWCILCAAAAVMLRIVLVAGGFDGAYTFTPCRLDGLMMGAFLALVMHSGRTAVMLAPMAKRIAVTCGAVLAMIWVVVGIDNGHWTMQTIGFTLLAALSAAVLVLLLAAPASGVSSRIFSSRFLGFFGKYSYGLYVFHYLLMPVFSRLFSVRTLADAIGHYWPARFASVALSFAVSIAAAWLSWHLYEKHFLKLKQFFDYGQTSDSATVQHRNTLQHKLQATMSGVLQR